MATTLDAKDLSLEDVHRLFQFEEHIGGSIHSFLPLEPLIELEKQELLKLRDVFRSYHAAGKISEGQVKFLTLAPLMWLAGFYQSAVNIVLEEGVAEISVTDEDTRIRGRMDILAVKKTVEATTMTPFWILIIESKNSAVDALEGLPQLLTYAYKSLGHQASVWGLITNGLRYQFVYIEQGNPSTYQLLPDMSLIYPESTIELLQVLKAICKL